MKFVAVVFIAFILIQCKPNKNIHPEISLYPPAFDSTLASKWGADEYGMKLYIIVLLKAGPHRPTDSLERENLQRAHMNNISRLAKEGKLLVAGPIDQDKDLKGIYLFDVRTIEEAKALTETDPAIQHGSLIMEMHPWYASAAMMEIPELHFKGAKKNF